MTTTQEILSAQYNLGFNSRLSKYRAEYLKYIITKYQVRSMMDVGSGIGEMFDYLEDEYPGFLSSNLDSIILVEPYSEYSNILSEKFGKNKLFTINSESIEDMNSDLKVDLVLAVDVLEHVNSPVDVILKLTQNLTPNGHFMAIVPNALSLHRQVGVHMGFMKTLYDLGEHDYKVGHQRYYDISTLTKDFLSAGMKNVEKSGIVFKPLPNSNMDLLSVSYVDALYQIGLEYPDFCGEIVGIYKI